MKKTIKIKPKRLISVFLALLVVLSTMMPAMASYAASIQCKLNIRTSTNYKYMNNWAYPNARNGIHLATVADGEHKGEVAYCIEFGKDMGETGQEETITDITDVPAWQKMNTNQRNGITRATIYGYPNFNYGVSNEAAQVATQFIVWEYSQDYRTSADGNNPTAGLNGTSSKIENAIEAAGFDVRQQYYKSGVVPYDDVMTAYKGILNGIKTHGTIPSFNSNTVELKWSNSNNRYEAKVNDSNGVLANFAITSGNSNLKFSKSGNTLTIYSTAVINSAATVTMTKTCTTVGADIGFVPDDQDYNQSLVGRLTDPVTATFKVKTATGNARIVKTSEDGEVEGIKFTLTGNGLTYTGVTDSKGVFLKSNIPAGTYTVTEESIDKYVPQKSQTVTVRGGETATVNFDNILKKFRVKVVKSDIEEGTAQGDASLAGATYGLYKGAEFQIYLKSAGSFVNAEEDERDTIVCDEDGFASSKLMPYGIYTVHQTKGWDGREKIKDFDVFINEDGKTYKFLINNANFESYVKVVKLDKETGKQIAYSGAGFEIYDSEGHRVTMQFTYPEVTEIYTFYTNSEGYLITPETLPYGDYTLVEVEAPYGYVLDDTPIPFTVNQENSSTDTGVTVVKVKAHDMAQKGVIEISKTGEVFNSVGMLGGGYVDENGNEVTFPITYQPLYEGKGLPGTVFQIYAAEDITTLDGTVRAYQGELVDEITTDKDGKAKSKELYLGKYTVIEKTATEGFYNSNEQYDVELTYAGQNVIVTSTALSLYNERQKVTVSIAKTLEQDETFGIGMNDEIKNVQFGIYANEDITAADGSIIPKDALITYASCNENGNINFSCDLPIGFKWYAKEIATDEHYVLSDEKYEFNTEYQGQEVQTIEIAVNDGEPIANELIYGTVKGIKTDRETGKTIEGAVFGLFRSDETEFTEENAVLTAESDKDGIFTFDNVPYGEWIVKELHPTENYLPSDDIHHITVSEDEQIIEINAVNDMIPELKTTASIDGEKEVEVQDKITIDDIVEYKHLVPGKEYIIKGVLMNKATNKPFTVDGKEITSEVSFVPEKPNGEVKVSFTFDAGGITENTEIVVFETLYLDGTELTTHADIEDEGQTVTITVPVPETPDTGDNRNYGVWIGLAAIALGAAVSALVLKIKANKEEGEE